MNRRHFLKSTGLSTVTALLGTSFMFKGCLTEDDLIGQPTWVVEGGFDRPLPLLPVAAGSNVQLNAGISSAEILKNSVTQTLSYSSGILGPVIRANTGTTVHVDLNNHLVDHTNIHWHGLVLPAEADGHPKDVAEPGGSLQYSLPIIQRAGTYWYHPHPHGMTAQQVFNGLAGMFIVHDSEELSLGLPAGDHELQLIIQDKRFSAGVLDYSPHEEEMMTGYLAEYITVNGLYAPYHEVAGRWYRMRLVNGSTARVYNLAFSDGHTFYVIGADGGLLKQPEAVTEILLGPGERLDILFDFARFAPGKEVFLESRTFSKYNVQGRQGFRIMKFVVAQTETDSFTLPASLSSINPLSSSQSVITRTFHVADIVGGTGGHGGGGKHGINHKVFDMARIDEQVRAGTTEVWEFDNSDGDEIHPMHIHGVQFQVLGRTGGRNALIASEKGWKDTVLVMPRENVQVIMTFPEYHGTYVFHCHNLEHEDDGMMLNYEILP